MGKSRELADFADKLSDDFVVHSNGDITFGYTTSSGEKFGVNGFLGFVGSHGSTPPSTNPSIARINSSDDLGFFTNGSERVRLEGSGNLLVGQFTSTNPAGANTPGMALGSSGLLSTSRDYGEAAIFGRRLDDGPIISATKDGTTVGSIGTNSTDPYFARSSGAGIRIYGGGFLPCTPTGANSDNALDIGASSARWDDIFATNGTIQTSDRNEKQDIEELSEAETRVAQACKGLLRKFRWVDAVEKKGDDARIHFGIIAQDLRDAFTAEGLDAGDYAMFISTTWFEDEEGQTHEEQNELGTLTERARLGVRYPELLAFIIASL